MSATLTRRPLTDAVLAKLSAVMVTGDGVLPAAGQGVNWIGQPNLPGSEFKPFAVLSPLFAGQSTGPVGDSQSDWRLPCMLELFGVTRQQCEWAQDAMRAALASLRHTSLTLGPSIYTVQYVHTDSIGAPTRIEVADPNFWHAQDGFTVWIGKDRS